MDSDLAPQEAPPAVSINSSFEFPPLLLDRKQIRLLKLQYRPKSTLDIRCGLVVRDLTRELNYTALSYTWGKRSTNKIIVNGASYFIYDNLFDFLALQSMDSEFCSNTYLWIDQICINQEHIEERNHQVDLMASIYRSAIGTIIWLGRPGRDNDMDDASLSWVMHVLRDPPPVPHPSPVVVHNPPSGLQRHEIRDCLKGFNDYPLYSLLLLSSCGYWDRVWIIQEVLLSRTLTIRCDSHTISWENVEQVYNNCMSYILKLQAESARHWLSRYGHSPFVNDFRYFFGRYLGALDGLIRARLDMTLGEQKMGELPWKEAIKLLPHAECEDPHDKIFALLGLVRPSVRIPPDYRMRMEEIYDQVLASEIKDDPGYFDRYEIRRTSEEIYYRFAVKMSSILEVHRVDDEMKAFIDGVYSELLNKGD